jgi:N-acetylneuraminic acid mutarotase|tara:strand:+ start:158 stop:1468 length:1311 start_codon:yes stop_codon:yes gene_type:complete
MKNLIPALLFLIISTTSFAQLEWESHPPIPEYGRYTSISFSIGKKIYVGLGHIPGGGYSNQLWEYSPSTKTWNRKANYPGNGLRLATAFSIGNKAYVGLGGNGISRYSDFYEYDPGTDSWTQKASFPGGNRYDAASFVIGDFGYVGTGSCGGTTCYNNDLYQYSPLTNTWTQRADFPAGNSTGVHGFSLDGFGYMGNARNTSNTLSNNYFKYNPSTNTWNSIASMPGTLRRTTSSFILGAYAYVGCGAYNYLNPIFQNDFYRYSPASDSWSLYTSNSEFNPRFAGIVAQVNDSSIFMGMGNSTNGYLSDLWQLKFNPDTCNNYDTTFITDTTYLTVQDTLTFYINTASISQPQLIGMQVYPNPASSEVTIAIADFTQMSSYTLKMYNTLGAEVYSQAVTTATYTINTFALGGAGTYYLEVYDSLNAKRGRKVIIIQ